MILQQSEQITPLNRIFLSVAALFSGGIALILLIMFYDAINEYQALLARVSVFGAVIIILSLTAYVALSVFLTIEHRALENQFFRESRPTQLVSNLSGTDENDDSDDVDDLRQRVLELHSQGASLNKISLDVYGKKGGWYADKVRGILLENGIST
jgi:hypothetical protein